MQRRGLGGRHAGDSSRERLRAESCSVHNISGGNAYARGAAGFDDEPSPSCAPGEDGRFERDHSAMGLGVASMGQHKSMAVDNAGRGRQQPPLRSLRGLERARLLAAEPDEIGDAVGLGLSFKRGELADLFRVHRHQELAAPLVRDAELLQLGGQPNSDRGIVPAQSSFRLRGVEGAVEIERLDIVGQCDEPVSEPGAMYNIERLSSVVRRRTI
jgi:hypothetical protein